MLSSRVLLLYVRVIFSSILWKGKKSEAACVLRPSFVKTTQSRTVPISPTNVLPSDCIPPLHTHLKILFCVFFQHFHACTLEPLEAALCAHALDHGDGLNLRSGRSASDRTTICTGTLQSVLKVVCEQHRGHSFFSGLAWVMIAILAPTLRHTAVDTIPTEHVRGARDGRRAL